MPTVRALAEHLGVSPTTVSAAYRTLRDRGLLVTGGRRGTSISPRPPLTTLPAIPVPPGVRDLTNGNPDRELLPRIDKALARVDPEPVLYGEDPAVPELLELARRDFEADGIPAKHLAVVGGAMDGIERVLQAHLGPGDRVAVEDPGFTAVLDLLAALGLTAVPVEIDDSGPIPESLARALDSGVQALALTPRAQNPYGSALDAKRARELKRILARHPDVLVIEDDHAGPVAGVPATTLCTAQRSRWAHVRSVSKSLGPDLRVAIIATDPVTLARLEGRQVLGMRWVSNILQRLVVALWKDKKVKRQLVKAERTYTERRDAVRAALSEQGIGSHGRSGINVWIPVPEEVRVVQAMLDAGWAVSAGERFRLRTVPGIRVCIASLEPADARLFARDLAEVLQPVRHRHSA